MMVSARCQHCQMELPKEIVSIPGAPCPACGSTNRAIQVRINDAEGVSDPTSALVKTGNRDKQFVETPRDGISTRTQFNEDDQLQTKVNGPSPQGECDTLQVCQVLVLKLNADGASWGQVKQSEEDGDIDCQATDENDQSHMLRIQVVRAIVDEHVSRQWAQEGEANLITCPRVAADFLREAIKKKADRTPPDRRSQLLLALDATRLVALSFSATVDEFKKSHLEWAHQLGFCEIWIVGPVTDLIRRSTAD